MAQTELMLRLIKDNKRVGYEWHGLFEEGSDQCPPYMITLHYEPSKKDNCGTLSDMVNPISHDSFELGIKVGGVWWFEGDRAIDTSNGLKGTVVYDEDGWGFTYDNREIPNTIGTSDLHDVLWEELEPIGNIHDKEE
jgi:hypothetical protein